MIRRLLLACVLCCGLGALTSALPARPASNTDAEASDEPDLLHMLDYFKGKSDMTMLVTFLKQAGDLKTVLTGLFDTCIICQQVFVEAGKSNVGIRILDKVVEGRAPDIRDMYDLATKGFGNMGTAYNEARKKNKKYNNLLNMLFNSTTLLTNPSDLNNALFAATGKNFNINPELLKEVTSGTVQINVNNMPQVNLLEMIIFWTKNGFILDQYFRRILTPPLNLQKLTSIDLGLDATNLAMIKATTGGINNGKYTVASAKQTIVTDPLAVRILKELDQFPEMQKANSADNQAAASTILNMLVDFLKLTSQVVKAAEVNRKVSTP